MRDSYVHGYGERETVRLCEQARTLSDLLHDGIAFAPGTRVLEAGCGVGAQTLELARRHPQAHFVALDISADSLAAAERVVRGAGLTNVEFVCGDLTESPFAPATFDAVFVCFVLEHLATPVAALEVIKRMAKPGGDIIVIEGDHGSALFHPDSAWARAAIQAQVDLQAAAGGDALIGRRLHPLLTEAGFAEVRVEPRQVYADGGRPNWAKGFTLNTFTAMIAGVRDAAINQGFSSAIAFDRCVADLARCGEPSGVFAYTFFRATAKTPRYF